MGCPHIRGGNGGNGGSSLIGNGGGGGGGGGVAIPGVEQVEKSGETNK